MRFPHMLTLSGALLVAYGAGFAPWATPVSGPEVAQLGYLTGPAGQVALVLGVLLALVACLRLAGRKPALDGPAVLTAGASLVWTLAAWRLTSSGNASLEPGLGMAAAGVGGALALLGTTVAYWGDRLRLTVTVSDGQGRRWRRVMTRPGSWSVVTPDGDSRPPVFHISDAGEVAIGVRDEDAGETRFQGHAVPHQRWFGQSGARVRAATLFRGDWGTCRSGSTVTTFRTRGRHMRGGRDGWMVGAVATVLLTQIGLMGLAVDDMQTQALERPTAVDQQKFDVYRALPVSVGQAPRLLEQSLEVAPASDLLLRDLPAAAPKASGGRAKTPSEQNTALATPRDLNGLLAAPGRRSPVAELLRRTPALEARMERMFDTSAVTSGGAKTLAFRTNSRALANPHKGLSSTLQRPQVALPAFRATMRKRVGAGPALGVPPRPQHPQQCDGLRKLLMSHRDRIAACTAAAVAERATRGSLRVVYRVGPNGRVRFSPLAVRATQRKAVRACLTGRFRAVSIGKEHRGCSGSILLQGG